MGITQLTQDVLAVGSGSVAATVVGLQGRALAATAPATGQILTWDGAQWVPGSAGARVILDAHDVGFWNFSETSGDFLNTGVGGACSLAPTPSAPYPLYGMTSPIGACVGVQKTSIQASATAGISPASAVTLMVLLYPEWSNASDASPFGTWLSSSTPLCSLYYYTNSAGDSQTDLLAFGLKTTSGVLFASAPGSDVPRVPYNQFSTMTLTYDAAGGADNAKLYANGNVALTGTATGNIDYSGGFGTVMAGKSSLSAGWGMKGLIGFMRIRDVAMTAAEVRAAHRLAMGWAG